VDGAHGKFHTFNVDFAFMWASVTVAFRISVVWLVTFMETIYGMISCGLRYSQMLKPHNDMMMFLVILQCKIIYTTLDAPIVNIKANP
jgi:hypothetical protein